MVQSSDRIRRWWAVPGSRVRAAGTVGMGEEEKMSGEKAVDSLYGASLRPGSGWPPGGCVMLNTSLPSLGLSSIVYKTGK